MKNSNLKKCEYKQLQVATREASKHKILLSPKLQEKQTATGLFLFPPRGHGRARTREATIGKHPVAVCIAFSIKTNTPKGYQHAK